MADSEETMFLLGQIKGQLSGINQRLDKLDSIDNRLRKVETKAALHGAIGGGAVGLGVSLLVASVKATLKTHGA